MKTIKFILIFLLLLVYKTGIAQETWYPLGIYYNGNPYSDKDINSVSLNCGRYSSIICGDSGYIGKWLMPEADGWVFNNPSITKKNLHSVFEMDSLILLAYIVGDSGLILKAELLDNYLFKVQNSNTTNHLYCVYFTPAHSGIIVGDSGKVLRTTDGGSHWNLINKVTQKRLYSVHFPSENTGFAVGVDGTVIKTTDNGQNWLLKPSAISDTLRGVWFTSDITGFVVSRNGKIIKTTNGGDNWVNKTSSTVQHLNSIRFISTNTGYAAGNNNTIVKTIDGGESWTKQTLPTLYRNGHFTSIGSYYNLVCFVGTNGTAAANFPDDLGGISEKKNNDIFTLSPNPAGNDITISLQYGQYLPGSNLIIINMQGKNLLKQKLNEQTTEINISQLPAGIYVAKLQLADGSAAQKKFVVIR